jgi:uncharacterized glyoxalase superfamily protein PhnB
MVRDGRAALEFYQKAFGAQVLYQAPMPGIPGIFAQFKIGESYLQLTDMPGFDPKGPRSPETLGGTSVAALDRPISVSRAATSVGEGVVRLQRQ